MAKGLGRGLQALLDDNEISVSGESSKNIIKKLKISMVEPDRNQPRKIFDDEKIKELADSIKERGVITPIIVRKSENDRYVIIAGERRWRASRMAGLTEIPAIIGDYTEKEAEEVALIENLQRVDLNPVEEALGYKQLMDKYSQTQEQVARTVGKSRPAVANSLRLLSLPEEIIEMLKDNKLSSGHARALLSLNDKETLIKTAKVIYDKDLSVRETEKIVKKLTSDEVQKEKEQKQKSPEITAVEKQLEERLGRKVKITNASSKGKIELEYYSKNDLDNLLELLLNE